MKNLYTPKPFAFVKVGDIDELKPTDPEALARGQRIGNWIIDATRDGYNQDVNIDRVADELAHLVDLLPEFQHDVFTGVATALLPVLRAGLGLAGWPDQGETIK
jgi:hypothetical protein